MTSADQEWMRMLPLGIEIMCMDTFDCAGALLRRFRRC